MKNTTFRKKALLSSIAMLLVAFIALGSATFAWFTANPTVTAEGISLAAETSAGLAVMSQSEKDWYTAASKTAVWDYKTVLNTDLENTTAKTPEDAGTIQAENAGEGAIILGAPVSFDYAQDGAAVFNTTTAANEDDYARDETKTIGTSTSYYSEKIYFKSTVAGQTTAVKSVKTTITPTADALAATVRVLVLDKDNNVIGTWNTDGAGNTYLTGGAVSADNFTASGNGAKINGLNLTATGTGDDYVTVYVFIDGEDDQCKTTNVTNLAEIISNIKIELSIND